MKIGIEPLEVISMSRKDLDLSKTQFCKEIVHKINPDILINLAAYTSVDLAETNSELAFRLLFWGRSGL